MFKMFTIRKTGLVEQSQFVYTYISYLSSFCPSSRKLKLHYKYLKFSLQDEQKNGKTSFPILHKGKREIRLIFMQLT